MKLRYTFFTAAKSVRINRSRSILTLLGIVIGITAIILVMSLGAGAEALILNQIEGLGSRTIVIEPGREPQGPSSFAEIFTDSLTIRDIAAIMLPSNVRGITAITPNVIQTATVSYENESTRVNVMGGAAVLAEIMDLVPATGRFFSDEDVDERAAVAVLGYETARKLFGESDAVGERIRVKDRTFRVIGILPKKGQVSFFDADNLVAVPWSTAQAYLLGIDHFHSVMVQAETEEIVPRVVRDITLTLRETHDIEDPSKDDFHMTTQADAAERVQMITGILTALLVSVAAISLVVGGIGIMNIMLVSVTERTREIGLRKALGAKHADILTQFLLEATLLTGVGGMIGILLGALLSFIVSVILSRIVSIGWGFVFPISAAVIGLSVSAAIGLVFGLYPARQAARKSPIEALRYE